MIGKSNVVQAIAIVYLVSSRDVFIEREELIGRIFEEQERHYEYLRQKEYKTRRFRHDLKNHMNLREVRDYNDEVVRLKNGESVLLSSKNRKDFVARYIKFKFEIANQ